MRIDLHPVQTFFFFYRGNALCQPEIKKIYQYLRLEYMASQFSGRLLTIFFLVFIYHCNFVSGIKGIFAWLSGFWDI